MKKTIIMNSSELPIEPPEETDEEEAYEEAHKEWEDGWEGFLAKNAKDHIEPSDVRQLAEEFGTEEPKGLETMSQDDLWKTAKKLEKDFQCMEEATLDIISKNHPEIMDLYKEYEPDEDE